ncbi:substrate-binding domain-containing protein [Limnobacter litoralis]|uniref:LysR family transcriptional regulator n=1 Tax=Limnobacter litoralis TaxID=481366 RepID=A0ABQ5YX15_9BURK|nr:substrate-binding domain-containing protein [Limnobacter litoralis]GLR27047.1 LysR family transcriptional regulator [Limnobacter litoralis]
MHKVSIKPVWTITDSSNQPLSPRLLDLLVDVQEHGSLSQSCKATGASYRHAWNLIRQGEAQLGRPLLVMERGKGSTLTPLGEKLVWAGHRISARLSPMLESLSSELEGELEKALSQHIQPLRVHASHGFAVEKLIDILLRENEAVERKYVGSQEAVASLGQGHCDLAGFHLPQGEFEAEALAHYARWLNTDSVRIINVATRRQGLMVARGNPMKIYTLKDLTRPEVRFVNRQPSSGTHFLLTCLLRKEGISPDQLNGFTQSEFTHAAVAAYVASGMADAGLGVETPSKRFKLDFVPMATERYFLACHEKQLKSPSVKRVVDVLKSEAFRALVNELPGYSAHDCGQIQTLQDTFPGHNLISNQSKRS